MGDDLSERQRALLLFIEDYVNDYGRPPTNREIGNGLGIPSTGHVDYHLKRLEEKGYITRESRTSRGIRLNLSMRKTNVIAPIAAGVRVMGAIAAGSPIDFWDELDVLDVVNAQRYTENAYALRVHGDSMIEDGIFSGDYVVIEPTNSPNTRDIIVATNLDGGGRGAATLKRFFREGDHVRLQPANATYDPIVVPAKEWDRNWQVQGRVAAIVRDYQEQK
jgi:repressor LexA